MANRKDKQGRVLHMGESWNSDKNLYCYSYMDTFGKRKFVYSKDLAKLREKERKILSDSADGLNVYIDGNANINYVFDRYLETKRDLKRNTRSNYIYVYEHFIRNTFGKKKITSVKYSDVIMFYNSILDKGMSISTVDNIHTVLHPTFELAVKDNIIRNNPSNGVIGEIKKKQNKYEGVRRALSIEHQREFFKWLNVEPNTRWRPFFVVLFGTGCRIGELIGLRWSDIDLENGVISINHNIVYCQKRYGDNKCEYQVSLPKTKAGIRIIPMLKEVKDAFLEEMTYQDNSGNKCKAEIDGMTGFIFFNRFGNIHNQSGINKVIKRIVSDHNAIEVIDAKREGREPIIIPMFSCHVARHTFCTRLCENETNIKVIQDIMGHKDIQTTLDIYAEVSNKKKKEVFENLNNNDIF